MVALATALGWTTHAGEPNKSKVQRLAERLKKAKLVESDRSGLSLTPKGKEEAKRHQDQRQPCGGSIWLKIGPIRGDTRPLDIREGNDRIDRYDTTDTRRYANARKPIEATICRDWRTDTLRYANHNTGGVSRPRMAVSYFPFPRGRYADTRAVFLDPLAAASQAKGGGGGFRRIIRKVSGLAVLHQRDVRLCGSSAPVAIRVWSPGWRRNDRELSTRFLQALVGAVSPVGAWHCLRRCGHEVEVHHRPSVRHEGCHLRFLQAR